MRILPPSHARRLLLGAGLSIAAALPAGAMQVAISEIMYHPAAAKPEFVEVWNFSRTPLDMAKWKFTNGIDFAFPDFNSGLPQDHILKHMERIIVSSAAPATTRAAYPEISANTRIFGPWEGSLDNAGETVTLKDKNGVIVSSITYNDRGWWPAGADGSGHSIHLVNENREHDDWHNWTRSRLNGGSPGRADTGERAQTEVVAIGSTWKYNDLGQNLNGNWTAFEFDDSAWPSGAALLGYETPGAIIAAPGFQTTLTKTTTISEPPEGYRQNLITYYFRKSFTWNGSTNGVRFAIDHIVDDGAVFYLNGAELGRKNLTGAVDYLTPAVPNVADAVEQKNAISGNIPLQSGAPALRRGLNVFAAELHNSGGGDSDAVFGARLLLEAFSDDPVERFRALRLSEVHFNGAGNVDWVEVRNPSAAPVDIDGLFLAGVPDFSDRQPVTGVVPAGGYLVLPAGLIPDNDGRLDLSLANIDGHIIDAAGLRRAPGKPSLQAVEGAFRYWQASTAATEGTANAPAGVITDIVINEIMPDPPSDSVNGEFIELYNRGVAPVNLTGWVLDDAVSFAFPQGTVMQPGTYLVIAANAAWLNSRYTGLTAIGNWDGRLSGGGELLTLRDASGSIADFVDFRIGGDWPALSGGDGTSLELINPAFDNSQPSAWRDSNESQKSAWTPISYTAPFRQYNATGGVTDYKELHLFLPGDSYVQVRNVMVQANGTGANLLTNGNVQSLNGQSSAGWLCQGTHWQSTVDGSGVLHLISDGHGDNRANRAEIDCTALTLNTNYTISLEARWMYGNPRLIVQTWDHSIGGVALVPIPDNLGTPGAANSRFAATPAPQLDGLLHSPAVPKTSDVVSVTAKVSSVSPLTSVQLFLRIDSVNNTNPWAPQTMYDDGTNGDATAGDGIYTAAVTAHQVDRRIVQFYVRADSQNGASATLPQGGADLPGMWIVDNRATLRTDLRRQRFIISDYWRSACATSTGQSTKFQYDFPRLANHYFPAVFIHDDREIYYGAGLRKTGSPWTRTDGSELDRGRWSLPPDRRFRGSERFSYDNDPTQGRMHHNRIIRYWLYLLGHPGNENEFCYCIVNSDAENIRESTEPESNDMLDRVYEDGSAGQLMRIDDEWGFTDGWSTRFQRDANWTYKGTDSTIRYHTEWMARSRENEYDYGPMIELFKTITDNTFTQQSIDRIMDGEKIAAMAAVRGYAGDWDSFTLNRGKNGFMYRPWQDGRWHFMHWDSDLAFQNTAEVVVGSLGGVRNYIDKPYNRRRLNYYLTELLRKYTKNSSRIDAWFAAEEAAAAFTVSKGTYTSWFTGRESRILSEINSAIGGGPAGSYAAAFNLTSPPATTSSDAINLTGTAPSSAWRVEVVGHPEAVQTFTNQTAWTISGIRLKEGQNVLTIRTIDRNGEEIQSINHTVNKTGNAPPVVVVTRPGGSWNAFPGEIVTLDTAGSYDPEEPDREKPVNPLTWSWSISPSAPQSGVPGATASWYFTTPGIYTVTVTAQDAAGGSTVVTRQITVFSQRRFANFGDALWPAWLTAQGVPLKSNYAPDKYYTLEDRPGSLLVRVTENGTQPLVAGGSGFPSFWTPLPGSADWAVQTEVDLTGREFASCSAGLIVELQEGGVTGRYVLAVENGTTLAAKRAQDSSAFANLQTSAIGTGKQALRIRRSGATLNMEYLNNGLWNVLHTRALPDGTTGIQGGMFVSTSVAQSVGVAFDYFGLVDPSDAVALGAALRITEVMYHPADGAGPEYIELTNISGSPINLNGVYFEQGKPFNQFTFGSETLAPGEFIVVTSNLAAFRSFYGDAPRVAGQWSGGSLDNSGETIILRDPQGALIQEFTYDDNVPWPEAADGDGKSLEVISTVGIYTDASNWRASTEMNGSPGAAGIGGDSDNDGLPDSLEIIAGTDPANGKSFPYLTALALAPAAPGSRTLQWTGVAGRTYQIEGADSLAGPWQTLTTVPYSGAVMSFTENGVTSAGRYYRMKITKP